MAHFLSMAEQDINQRDVIYVTSVTCFGLKINKLPSCIARDIFRAVFVDDLVICFRGPSLGAIGIH